nr:uncharacterized protein LOC100181449 [Ciona intestinalis]|eukprot:XP_002122306.2 uncharacterized protein LOC100181449 [Ciona intestinalis]
MFLLRVKGNCFLCLIFILSNLILSSNANPERTDNRSTTNATTVGPQVQTNISTLNSVLINSEEEVGALSTPSDLLHQNTSSDGTSFNGSYTARNFRMETSYSSGRSTLLPRIVHHRTMKTFTSVLAVHVKRMIRSIDCHFARRYFTDEGKCETLSRIPTDQMRFYVTPPRVNTVYSVTIPEGRLRDSSSHHSVAVVDPFPTESFGHLLLVFYIDGATRPWCKRKRGIEIGPGLCLTQARRSGCRNIYRSHLSPNDLAKKCEINFIPLVYDEITNENAGQTRQQLLECMPYISGFGPCPKTVVTESTIVENCELIENTRRCYSKKLRSSQIKFPPLCRLYATCDYAVTLFGGWNDVTMVTQNEENLRSFYTMLRRNGFRKDNIQVFYNGNGDVKLGEPYRYGLPASEKFRIRNHITTICRTSLCADSLVIYMNGPTDTEGSLLLWDNNGNGESELSEKYLVTEFLDDIAGCDANHVFVFADQSYSGVLTSALRQRVAATTLTSWERVVLIASGDTWDYSWGRDVTSHWSRLSPLQNVAFAYEGLAFTHSLPSITHRRHAEDFTLFGAPISEGLPEYSDNPTRMRRQYMGCQKLPLPQWLINFQRNQTPDTNT